MLHERYRGHGLSGQQMLEFIRTQLIDIIAIALRNIEHFWNAFLIWTFPVRDHEVYVVPIF
jgi:hypothetical protein